MQKEWPHVFFDLEMEADPPDLFTPSRIDRVEAPEPTPPRSSPDRIGDEIMQRVNWLRSNLSAWSRSCARYHYLLREHDKYIHKLREKIVNDDIYIWDVEWQLTEQRRKFEEDRKHLRDETERAKAAQAELQTRNQQLGDDLKKSHTVETLLQTHAETPKKRTMELEPLALENERLK